MKKLFVLLVGVIFLGSCRYEATVFDTYYIVTSVEKIEEPTSEYRSMHYKVKAEYGGNSKIEYYTNTIYTVGDTIKMK